MLPCLRAALLVACHPALPAMASLSVLTFDHDGHPIQYDTWLDDLHLHLLSDSRDSVLLFDHTSRASLAPPAIVDSATYSQWLTRDAAALLAVRNNLSLAERAHIGQNKTAKALYDAVVALEDLVSYLRTSDARYRAALPAEFLDRNPRPIYTTLYFIVTRLPDSLCAVRDHFLALDPTDLTVNLLEHHLLAAETSIVAVGAARGTPRTPFFEGMSRLLLLLVGSAVAARARVTRVVAVAARVVVAVAAVAAVEVAEVVAAVGVVAEVGAAVGVAAVGVAVVAAVGVVAVEVELFRGEVLGVAKGSSSSVRATPLRPSSFILATRLSAPTGQSCLGLDYDAIHAAMYALSVSAEGDCYRCVPPDPGIGAAALGASEFALPGTVLAKALHTFTLDSADPSRGPVLARSSTILPCLAVPSGSLSGLHLPSFSTNLVSTAALQDAMVTTTTPGGVRVRSGSSPLLVSPPVAPDSSVAPPPWSLPSPAPPCLPCIEGRQRAALHSSFPPTTAPLQTLHMDLWGPARVSGQDCERYFLVVVDEYTRYTMVFPLRSKGQVPDVLIPWIRAVRPQLREWFCEDLPVLRLHSGRGGEFSSELLRDFCCGEGILQSFTLLASPQKNGIAERRIVRCASPQPLAPCLLAGDLAYTALDREGWRCVVFRVWGSRAFVRDTSADKLSAYAIPFDFLGFPPNAPGCSLLPSLPLPHCPSPPPPPLFLAPGPPPVVPLPPQGPAPSGASQVDPLPGTVTVKVAVDSGTARGAASGVAASRGAEPGGAEPEGAEPRGAESEGAESGGDESGGAEPGGTEPAGAEPEGAESEGAESGGAEPRGTASAGGSAGASPQLSPRREPFSPQQLREWFSQCTRLRSGAAGAGGSAAGGTGAGGARATRLGGAGVTAGAGVTRGAGAAGP
ncbi:unnamed protein product [Closterium sp. NIES-53]